MNAHIKGAILFAFAAWATLVAAGLALVIGLELCRLF